MYLGNAVSLLKYTKWPHSILWLPDGDFNDIFIHQQVSLGHDFCHTAPTSDLSVYSGLTVSNLICVFIQIYFGSILHSSLICSVVQWTIYTVLCEKPYMLQCLSRPCPTAATASLPSSSMSYKKECNCLLNVLCYLISIFFRVKKSIFLGISRS